MNEANDAIAAYLDIYYRYWSSYLAGDIEVFASIVHPDFEMIGTSANEICHSREEGITFVMAQQKELGGKVDMRNRQISPRFIGEQLLINEQSDVYVETEGDWHYYDTIRISTLLQPTTDGWKVLQQHGSFPDTRVEKNETLSFQRISKENQELREAVQRRTRELELKNRDLEIEASLERVRLKSLAMHQTSELQSVIHTVHEELLQLNLSIFGGSFIVINSELDSEIKCWGAGGTAATSHQVNIPRFDKPFYTNLLEGIKKGPGFFTEEFTAAEKLEFFTFLFTHEPWSTLSDEEKKQTLETKGGYTRSCVVSEHTSIFIINHEGIPFSDADNAILKRFGKVFEQSYTRFLDLQKAEKQAKEAEIQLALERIRAKTMAMNTQSDLLGVIKLFGEQLNAVNIRFDNVTFIEGAITKYRDWDLWSYVSLEEGLAQKIHIPYIQTPYFNKTAKAVEQYEKTGQTIHVKIFTDTEKNEFLDHYWMYAPEVPREVIDSVYSSAGSIIVDAFMEEITVSLVRWDLENYQENELDIFERFAKEFKQTYIRFLDIKKAEAQAREAKIEAALEKVRSRSLAMHSSAELAEVAVLLFEQIQQLGVQTFSSGFNIWDNDHEHLISWMSNATGEINPPFQLPIHAYEQHKRIHAAWENKASFLEDDIQGEAIIRHYAFLRSFPLLDESFKQAERAGIKIPDRQVHNIAFFSNGYLLFITHEPTPQNHAIYQRFAKVFDQAYTRFLDLQKAEAQARQAQIEFAVERVRAKALAMHKSTEILQVAITLKEQMEGLNLSGITAATIYLEHDDGKIRVWDITELKEAENGPQLSSDFIFRLDDTDPGLWVRRIWHASEKYSVIEMSGDDFIKCEKWIREFDETAADNYREFIRAGNIEHTWHPTVQLEKGKLNLDFTVPPPPEMEFILPKMGAAFDLAYRRFLDLQKAEAQAREAQVQLALERVRARTMAMHQSSELNEVASVLFEQIRNLGGKLWGSGFALCNSRGGEDEFWFANELGIMPPVTIPNTEDEVHRAMLKGWKEKKDYLLHERGGADLAQHYQYLNSLPQIKAFFEPMLQAGFTFPDWQQWHSAYFSKGYLLIITVEPYPEPDILVRFAKVFEQTYTRFLDLQKAENQAREAQIELAVERVRARALAMYQSKEILEVVQKLKEEIMNLDIPQVAAATIHLKEADGRCRAWDLTSLELNEEGLHLPLDISFRLEDTHPDFFMRKIWAHTEDYFVVIQKKSDFPHTVQWLIDNGHPQQAEEARAFFEATQLEQAYHPTVPLKNGRMGIDLLAPPEDEVAGILKKMAAAFDLAYKRFEDLKNAEFQTREAQIQLALERVRARSMAMQSSDELAEVSNLLNKQVVDLGIPTRGCAFNIYGEKDSTEWFSNLEGTLPTYNTPRENIFLKYYEAGQRGETMLIEEFGGEKIKAHYRYLLSTGIFGKDISQENIEALTPEFQIDHVAYFKYGYLLFITLVPAPDAHDIFKRFAKEFEQTYTRFLDLQKAEAQAKEAKIEAALERVRSRSLAMHHSNELSSVVDVLLTEFTKLEFKLSFCIINLIDGDDLSNTVWAANPETGKDAESYYMKFEDYPFHHAMWHAWKQQKKRFIYTIEGEEKKTYDDYLFTQTEFKRFPLHVQDANRALKRYVAGFTFFPHSGLQTVTEELITEEDLEILERFGRVFEQAYTRFLDLQKAEAQAREAQIAAALERVRSRGMGMQKSEELQVVIKEVYDQLKKLDIQLDHAGFVVDYEPYANWHFWIADEQNIPSKITHPYFESVWATQFNRAKISGDASFTTLLNFEEKNRFYEELLSYVTDLPQKSKDFYMQCAGLAATTILLEDVSLYVENFSATPYSEEDNNIFLRFGKVFQQTYIRFLDLQKAEAQAREAQMQLALERVRARTMAMQKSEELSETALLVHQQFRLLAALPEKVRMVISILNEQREEFDLYITNTDGSKLNQRYAYSINEPYVFRKAYQAVKRQDKTFVINLEGDDLTAYLSYMEQQAYPITFRENVVISCATFSSGYFCLVTADPIADEILQLLSRFAQAFDLTYTRFIDLQKAEAQAKEAQVEAALERVRAQAMAMHHTDDLGKTIRVFYEQLKNLISSNIVRCGAGLLTKKDTIAIMSTASQNGDGATYDVKGSIDMSGHPLLQRIYAQWLEQQEYHGILRGNEIKVYYQYMTSQIAIPQNSSDDELHFYFPMFSEGSIYLVTKQEVPEEELRVFRRFSSTISLAYRRFDDLKRAEEQAREAQIEAALERVRSRTLAMQHSDELAETSAVLFQQMIGLGIAPNRLYITVIHPETDMAEFWITDEDGSRISKAYTASMYDNTTFVKMYDGWKNALPHLVIDMHGEELQAYFTYLQSRNVPFKGGLQQQRRVQHLAYFSNGFIGLASPDEQPAETIQILERFASVFNLTFTRFNDLKVAEAHAAKAEQDLVEIKAARQKAELALKELKATQAQLIQSEKMASLGELTAGIAHEIQNPLNFVNNFSEINDELISELVDALNTNDTDEAKAIAADIKNNAQKINEHGRRAGSIVKGMLEHSRKSEGKKELTDLNQLADECLRLSFHGLRAKDKSFSADFKTDFDANLPMLEVVAQDIGRVLLNLMNNAFYAVNAKAQTSETSYQPQVVVSTSVQNGKVMIAVEDNGTGITDETKGKIFQPFFTTKPTGQGTGLGLSLSFDIITKGHGGNLILDSIEGDGARFIIQLPIQ